MGPAHCICGGESRRGVASGGHKGHMSMLGACVLISCIPASPSPQLRPSPLFLLLFLCAGTMVMVQIKAPAISIPCCWGPMRPGASPPTSPTHTAWHLLLCAAQRMHRPRLPWRASVVGRSGRPLLRAPLCPTWVLSWLLATSSMTSQGNLPPSWPSILGKMMIRARGGAEPQERTLVPRDLEQTK